MRPTAIRMALLAATVAAATLPAACSSEQASPQAKAAPTPSGSGNALTWTALDSGGNGTEELEPGRYGLRTNGLPGMPVAVVDVPAGLANLGGWVVVDPKVVRGVGYWTVSGVDRDPCGEALD